MNLLVKETLFLVDYDDNILDTLFISTDKRTPGYAYEIMIKDHNTGHSDLSFKMPGMIVDDNGETIKNPKLEKLVPLSRVRYNRTITYMGEEIIGVPEPDGTVVYYPKNEGKNPKDYELENYTMDYIIQPLDKSRQSMNINLTYTAIDYPRFNLSKKKVGLTFDNTTLTTQELSLYKNVPLSSPGVMQYIPWTEDLVADFQRVGQVNSADILSSQNANAGDLYYVVNEGTFYQKLNDGTWAKTNAEALTTWSPNAQAQTYPLDDAAIDKLIRETDFSYGILATIYYWPVTESGRFRGVWYDKGGFITLSLYNTYEGSDWEGSDYLESIAHKWGHLDPMQPLLSPNNACNYLRYILKDTNWGVAGSSDLFIAKDPEGQKWFAKGEQPEEGKEGEYYITYEALEDDKYNIEIFRYEDGEWINKTGTTLEQIVNTDINDNEFGMMYDIDIEQVEVSRSAEASLGQIELTDARYALSVNNANCYNAITSEAKLFDLYPKFDCEHNKVSLKLNAGKDYGLSYRYKSNLKSSNIKVDGEKVITKLYVTGGTDAQGDKNISIGEANRIISGTGPILTSAAMEPGYLQNEIKTQMSQLEENIYNHINGAPVYVGLNMSDKKFILNFPDKLFDLEITDGNRKSTISTDLVVFSSGTKISKLYNPTGIDFCYYIYINDGADSYKDESKQLYKFDGANITLRRNLTEYAIKNIGSITSISDGQSAITTKIKYSPELPANAKQDDKLYIGSIINADTTDGLYVLNDINMDESFVLCGPDRVYKVPAGQTELYNYGVGNYYYIEDTGTYRYCVNQYTDSGGIYSKINNISVNGYIFIDLGTPETELNIQIDGNNTKVLNKEGVALTLQEWIINDFSMRVVYDGTNLMQNTTFDPNAEEYLIGRSPYGVSYIYNFKYLLDNKWMEESDVLDIYEQSRKLNDLNLEFYDRYNQDLINIRAAYNDAINNYDLYSSRADAQLEALMSQYWVNPNKASDGQFSAFPGMPADVSGAIDLTTNKYYMDITYDEIKDDGTTESIVVKRVYFDVFGTTACNENYPDATALKTTNDNPETEGQYHVVAKAIGWEDNYTKLTINSKIGPYSEAQDPSKTAESYNKFISQMKEYYYRAMKADEQMVEAQAALEELTKRLEEWQNQVSEIERYIQENYGDFIIEGSYSNTEQPYPNLLIKDGLDASDKYSTPDITYTVGVVDSSGLFEFRNPQKLLCNDLIKRLHNVGQVAPHVGDYVSIQDEPMGMYGVPGLITQISRRIDDPYQNSVTIDTSYTDADELVGNIITATNTVLNNKDIYGRAAIINNKGELLSTTVSKALSTGTNSINIVSTNGKVAVDDNGLTCVSPDNKDDVMRYNGAGIFGSSNGGATWRELLSQDGINANYIGAGTINASKVSITDGGHDITTMNADGLVVKTTPNKSYVLGALSENGPTKDFENITVFVGRDANGNGVGYFNGYINASKGGKIGGWSINKNYLYSGEGSSFVGLGNSGDYRIWAGNADPSKAPFSVKKDGSMNSTSGSIGDWEIGTNTISQSHTASDGKVYTVTLANYNNDNAGSRILHCAIDGVDTFYVHRNGKLYAKNADIEGKITATSGSFTGTINASQGKIGNWTISDGKISNGSVTLTSGGTITANNVSFGNTSKIAGWTVNASSISNGTDIAIYSNGRLSLKKHGWLNAGDNGYWLLGNGSSYRCLVGDGFDLAPNIADALGTVKTNVGTEIPTVGMSAKNGHIQIRNTHSGGHTRIATSATGGIAIEAGYAGTNYPGQVYISGNCSGDGTSSGESGIMMYTPNGSIRMNATTNVFMYGGGIVLESDIINIGRDQTSASIKIGEKLNSSGKIAIGTSSSSVTIKGSSYTTSSSRRMKENIKTISTQEKEELYKTVKDMNFYSYNYKKEYGYGDEEYRGFIIDEIEDTIMDKYLHFIQDKDDSNVKSFNPTEMGRMNLILINLLQQKIDDLQQEINTLKKEKTN